MNQRSPLSGLESPSLNPLKTGASMTSEPQEAKHMRMDPCFKLPYVQRHVGLILINFVSIGLRVNNFSLSNHFSIRYYLTVNSVSMHFCSIVLISFLFHNNICPNRYVAPSTSFALPQARGSQNVPRVGITQMNNRGPHPIASTFDYRLKPAFLPSKNQMSQRIGLNSYNRPKQDQNDSPKRETQSSKPFFKT